MNSTPKQTARNSKFLRGVKKIMNKPTYEHIVQIVNESGNQAAIDYLNVYLTRDATVERFENWESFFKHS